MKNENGTTTAVPDWDIEQLEVIMDETAMWQKVSAGPGAGKSAVACQRVAFLIDQGVPASRILLVSFTRTAVTELRDRIIDYSMSGARARSIKISTIDSHAWSLRIGFDDEPIPKSFAEDSYDLSIERVVELFRKKQPELIDFMSRFEHVIIDEAQDVMGVRADLLIEILRSLSSSCGVTIFADPAQAIYGFTNEEEENEKAALSFLERLESESPKPFTPRRLSQIYRIRNEQLREVFNRTRHEIESPRSADGHVSRVQSTIRDTCANCVGEISHSGFPALLRQLGAESSLVLFRTRADVLLASSYCSAEGIVHRLRMSGMQNVVQPWLGWLFGQTTRAIVSKEQFDVLWEHQASLVPTLFEGLNRDESWRLLHRLAAASRPDAIDLMQLRRLIARSRPPIDLCYPDVGNSGPILGTIHASKGREADTVVLVMPPTDGHCVRKEEVDLEFEEGRVYYVGATRARIKLVAAGHSTRPFSHIENTKRVFRKMGTTKIQLEIGHEGDVDPVAHLCWTDPLEIQQVLAASAKQCLPIKITALAENDYEQRLILSYKAEDGITRITEVGQMSESFRYDFGKVWKMLQKDDALKPPTDIPHVYMVGVSTIGLTDDQRMSVPPPFNQSGFALAPVIKGFPTVTFFHRRTRRNVR